MARWEYQDDLTACRFYLKHKGKSLAKVTLLDDELNHKFTINSLKAKLGNYAYLATGKGLKNCNFQSKYIYRLLTNKISVKNLSSAAKGKQTADVANASIRNILTLVSKYMGYVKEKDVFDANRFFGYRCPYTGEDLTAAVLNREKGIKDPRVEIDHIIPQNERDCGLNVKGNLIWVSAKVNHDKSNMSYEEFINTYPPILATTTQAERDLRIAEIRKYQTMCGYEPGKIKKAVGTMLRERYEEVQRQQLDIAAKIVKKAKL